MQLEAMTIAPVTAVTTAPSVTQTDTPINATPTKSDHDDNSDPANDVTAVSHVESIIAGDMSAPVQVNTNDIASTELKQISSIATICAEDHHEFPCHNPFCVKCLKQETLSSITPQSVNEASQRACTMVSEVSTHVPNEAIDVLKVDSTSSVVIKKGVVGQQYYPE
jgi:hypothetical protein